MLGIRSAQRGLFEADYLYRDFVGPETFYGFLASQRGQLFRDADFAALYVLDNGRPSVPPSLLATALLLQTYDRVSDEEAKERADFDLRWKVALGIGLEERPFAKSTLQVFRAQLILHDEVRTVFKKSLTFARQTGYLKPGKKIKLALDTSNILGRGAVKDTYNLLADGIVQLTRTLAELGGEQPEVWAAGHDLARYFGTSSLKGAADIDWGDAQARQTFLQRIVADADRLLALTRQTLSTYDAASAAYTDLTAAAELLGQLLLQDIERTAEGAGLKEGVSRDRVVSVHDPEMRHGRKSKSKRFDGHKGAVAVDPESQLITAGTVLAGNAPDNTQALELVEQTEENAQVEVDETMGDCAYGDGSTRQAFAEAGRRFVAKVPDRANSGQIPKEDFRIDLERKTCTCPEGQACDTLEPIGGPTGRSGETQARWGFKFDPAVCAACPRRAACVRAGPGKGRTVSLHPQEKLLQEARAFQRSDAFGPYRQMRQAAEHRLARLMQLGMRQARYFGRVKTLYQLLMAATVANLTLVAAKVGLLRCRGSRRSHSFTLLAEAVLVFITAFVLCVAGCRGLPGQNPAYRTGSRPGF